MSTLAQSSAQENSKESINPSRMRIYEKLMKNYTLGIVPDHLAEEIPLDILNRENNDSGEKTRASVKFDIFESILKIDPKFADLSDGKISELLNSDDMYSLFNKIKSYSEYMSSTEIICKDLKHEVTQSFSAKLKSGCLSFLLKTHSDNISRNSEEANHWVYLRIVKNTDIPEDKLKNESPDLYVIYHDSYGNNIPQELLDEITKTYDTGIIDIKYDPMNYHTGLAKNTGAIYSLVNAMYYNKEFTDLFIKDRFDKHNSENYISFTGVSHPFEKGMFWGYNAILALVFLSTSIPPYPVISMYFIYGALSYTKLSQWIINLGDVLVNSVRRNFPALDNACKESGKCLKPYWRKIEPFSFKSGFLNLLFFSSFIWRKMLFPARAFICGNTLSGSPFSGTPLCRRLKAIGVFMKNIFAKKSTVDFRESPTPLPSTEEQVVAGGCLPTPKESIRKAMDCQSAIGAAQSSPFSREAIKRTRSCPSFPKEGLITPPESFELPYPTFSVSH